MNAAVQILNRFFFCAYLVPILRKAAVAVDGTGGDGREEQQEGQVLQRIDLLDQIILHAQQHIHTAEGDVRKAEKNERGLLLEER